MNHRPIPRVSSLVIALVYLIVTPTAALVTNQSCEVSTSRTELNRNLKTINPGWPPFRYWDYIGLLPMGTAIYLGDGFVLTASHVGSDDFTHNDGSAYKKIPGSDRIYPNPDRSLSELLVYRVLVPAGSSLSSLVQLNVSSSRGSPKGPVLLLGTGLFQNKRSSQWNDDHRLRWGINYVQTPPAKTYQSKFGKCEGFYTIYEGNLSGQGAPGDSGGAAFAYNPAINDWQLVGINMAMTTDPDLSCSDFGDKTFIATLNQMQTDPIKILKPRIDRTLNEQFRTRPKPKRFSNFIRHSLRFR